MSQAPVSNVEDLIRILREHMPMLASRFHVQSIGVFGSYVRGSNRSGSDLDVLVSFHEVPGLIDFLRLENYLTDTLGVNVDLVMRDALKPRIGRRILAEVVPV